MRLLLLELWDVHLTNSRPTQMAVESLYMFCTLKAISFGIWEIKFTLKLWSRLKSLKLNLKFSKRQ